MGDTTEAVVVSTDEVIVASAIIGGIVSNRIIDVGSGPIPNIITFFVGAIPALLISDMALNDDGLNLMLIQRSVNFMTSSPISYAIMTIGMITVFSLAYNLFLSEEVMAFEALVPLLRTENVDLAIVVLGGVASLVFGAIAGWTIDVMEWMIAGGDKDLVPIKPGGRTVWGLSKLPKDLAYLIFAVPIGILDQTELAIGVSSLVPILMIPLKIACDQWTRLGDIIIDAISVEEFIGTQVKHAWHDFDDVCMFFKSHAQGILFGHHITPNPSLVAGVHRPNSYTAKLMGGTKGGEPTPDPPNPNSDDPYQWIRDQNDGQMYHLHPFLFEDGDATPTPPTS